MKNEQAKRKDMSEQFLQALDYRCRVSTNSYHHFILPGTRQPSKNHFFFREVVYNSKHHLMKVE